MDNSLSNQSNVSTDTAVAYPSHAVNYGVASGVEHSLRASSAAPSLGSLEQLQYLWGEYGKGILFVLASSLFILAIPAFLSRPAELRAVIGRIVKRSMDLVGAILGLVLTLPLWVVLPFLIKLDSRGPVFYTQSRVGCNRRKRDRRFCQKVGVDERRRRDRRRDNYLGRTFRVFKFRTMIHNAERESGAVWASEDDPRITRIGRILRKTRLDEIPQFINVLLGDMSLVGPRPERPEFVGKLNQQIPGYARRLSVRPGLTGLAQVEGGYDSSLATVAEKVERDLRYIEEWSLWADIKILLRTIVVVLTGRGAN